MSKTQRRNMEKLNRGLRKKLGNSPFDKWEQILEESKHHILLAAKDTTHDK